MTGGNEVLGAPHWQTPLKWQFMWGHLWASFLQRTRIRTSLETRDPLCGEDWGVPQLSEYHFDSLLQAVVWEFSAHTLQKQDQQMWRSSIALTLCVAHCLTVFPPKSASVFLQRMLVFGAFELG